MASTYKKREVVAFYVMGDSYSSHANPGEFLSLSTSSNIWFRLLHLDFIGWCNTTMHFTHTHPTLLGKKTAPFWSSYSVRGFEEHCKRSTILCYPTKEKENFPERGWEWLTRWSLKDKNLADSFEDHWGGHIGWTEVLRRILLNSFPISVRPFLSLQADLLSQQLHFINKLEQLMLLREEALQSGIINCSISFWWFFLFYPIEIPAWTGRYSQLSTLFTFCGCLLLTAPIFNSF